MVLVVDDESAVLALARHVLQACGYTTLEARTTDAALRLDAAHPGPIHLLLTDVCLARECGRALAAVLMTRRPGLKVLFMSGFGEDAVAPRSPGWPANFLAKPFPASLLAAKVRAVLDAP